jgi:uncharacterized membrane protein
MTDHERHPRRPLAERPPHDESPLHRNTIGLAAVALTITVAILTLLQVDSPIRVALALLYSTLVPGWAIFSNLPSVPRRYALPLSLAVSLSIEILVATIAVWLRFWHPLELFYAEALASTAAIGLGFSRRRRSHDSSST